MSEIDDIFASKGKAKIHPPPKASSSSLPEKKKEKKRKQKPSSTSDTLASSTSNDKDDKASRKRPPPETVVDPSVHIPSIKRQKVKVNPILDSNNSSKPQMDTTDESKFKDSRGSGPRRKTEEGWGIYKEDELGIGDEGGDTPLCPFDCDCCF